MDKIGILLLISSGATNAVANALLKIAFSGHSIFADGIISGVIKVATNPWAMGAIAMFGVSFLIFGSALGRVNLSMAYPFMSGTAFLLIFLITLLFFKERINVWGAVGAFSILFGIILISVKG